MASTDNTVRQILRALGSVGFDGCMFDVHSSTTGELYIWCRGPKFKPGDKKGAGYAVLTGIDLLSTARSCDDRACIDMVERAMVSAWRAAGFGDLASEVPFRLYRRGAKFMRRAG
jgi:hypothetical protein